MTLRSDIHAALDPITPAAPHLPSTVVDALLASPAPPTQPRRAFMLALTVAAVAVVLVALSVVGLSPLFGALGRTGPASTQQPPPAPVVITKWVKDPTVVNGPWPGYRPQMAFRPTFASVNAVRDPNGGGDWVVQFTLDQEGTQAFASLTGDAFAAACTEADICPEQNLTNWLGLNQDDIDHWNERANDLYKPYAQGGKLLSDPVIQSPITGGRGYIAGNFDHEMATDLARRLGGK